MMNMGTPHVNSRVTDTVNPATTISRFKNSSLAVRHVGFYGAQNDRSTIRCVTAGH